MLGYKLIFKGLFPYHFAIYWALGRYGSFAGKRTLFLVMAPTTNSYVTSGAFGGDKLLIQSALSWF